MYGYGHINGDGQRPTLLLLLQVQLGPGVCRQIALAALAATGSDRSCSRSLLLLQVQIALAADRSYCYMFSQVQLFAGKPISIVSVNAAPQTDWFRQVQVLAGKPASIAPVNAAPQIDWFLLVDADC